MHCALATSDLLVQSLQLGLIGHGKFEPETLGIGKITFTE